MYAILDIETTGGKFNEEGITEIAIHKFDGQKVVDQFISLVNPEKDIQEFVVKLTGINNKMLRNAPKFHEVAKRIIEITKGCILVAHNSSFDYRILKTEYNRLGYNFEIDTLCTVELSQKLLPDLPSYSLGKLCKSIGIPMSDRHRANGDALATVQLFKILLEKDVEKNIIQQSTKYSDNRTVVNKLKKIIDEAPKEAGVFYLLDKDGKVIFLGRGKSIKKELNKVFLKTSTRAKKIQERVASISHELTGNELLTRIKYQTELELLKPKYNISKKKKTTPAAPFNNDDFLIIDNGRTIEENAIILVENNEIIGYGFTNLAFQENQIDILKEILTPVKNKLLAKRITKNYLKTNKVKKLVRL